VSPNEAVANDIHEFVFGLVITIRNQGGIEFGFIMEVGN